MAATLIRRSDASFARSGPRFGLNRDMIPIGTVYAVEVQPYDLTENILKRGIEDGLQMGAGKLPVSTSCATRRETNGWKWPGFMVGYLFAAGDNGGRHHTLSGSSASRVEFPGRCMARRMRNTGVSGAREPWQDNQPRGRSEGLSFLGHTPFRPLSPSNEHPAAANCRTHNCGKASAMPDGLSTSNPSARQAASASSDVARAWMTARSAYEALLADFDKDKTDQSGDAVSDALDDLIVLTRSPDVAALLVKLDLIAVAQAGYGLIPSYSAAVRADVAYLADAA